MKANEFIDRITEPENWRIRSLGLRISADTLWDRFIVDAVEGQIFENRDKDDQSMLEWHMRQGMLYCSFMLYGLALETAFKYYLVLTQPEQLRLTVVTDGLGDAYKASLQQLGVSSKDGHSLTNLADAIGFFEREGHPLYTDEREFAISHNLLSFLTEQVMWRGRYPAPTQSGETHEWPDALPKGAKGEKLRDWVDPILDLYLTPKPPAT